MAPVAAFVSFRFGDTDGVSAVARSWIKAFQTLGFETLTVSGESGSTRTVPGLGLHRSGRPVRDIGSDLEATLADADVVVVENLLTIPMNLDASRAAMQVLRGRRALVHHHDPPWHRERFAHIDELPVDDDQWRHVAINTTLRSELHERGIEATLIYNGFEPPTLSEIARWPSIRRSVRHDLGVADDEILIAHPVRAIERKNIPAAIRLCEELGATYWLLGPPEEGYAVELDRLLSTAQCRVIHRRGGRQSSIYAACDHVTFPSTWEGFGNPPIEAAFHRRTVSVGTYPVATELQNLGFDWFDSDDLSGIRDTLADSSDDAIRAMLDQNESIARAHFSQSRVEDDLGRLLIEAGWSA